MTAQWIKYDGSDEQIAEMRNAEHGFMAKNITSISSVMSIKFNQLFIQGQKGPYLPELFGNKLENFLTHNNTIEYLICTPHLYADMICQQARTGQPVWLRITNMIGIAGINDIGEYYKYTDSKGRNIYKTNAPNWNIPGAEYSFTPFEDK